MKRAVLATLALCAVGLVLGGCASSQSANTYTTANAQQKMVITHGVITALRDVKLEKKGSGTGGLAGAAAGGTLGSYAGGGNGGRPGILGAIAGAVIGGVGGALTDKAVNSNDGVEITYKCDEDGREYAVAQDKKGSEGLQVGDHVRVLDNGLTSRIVKA